MGSYFKPWRRKFGVVTLVMACVFAGGWVKTLTRYEEMSFHASANLELFIESGEGIFSFGRLVEKNANNFSVLWYCRLPYWLLVIPLTLLSGWLLLSKPRRRQTPIEPIPEKAA